MRAHYFFSICRYVPYRVKCVESPGGSALNTARLLTHLGNNALFIGLVGDDEAGNKLRKYFTEHNIDVR